MKVNNVSIGIIIFNKLVIVIIVVNVVILIVILWFVFFGSCVCICCWKLMNNGKMINEYDCELIVKIGYYLKIFVNIFFGKNIIIGINYNFFN